MIHTPLYAGDRRVSVLCSQQLFTLQFGINERRLKMRLFLPLQKPISHWFPEILMVDVTHGTNSETRPLCVSASIDANMKTFTPIRAFLPSECQWVFHWLWASAIPSLLGIEAIRRIQLVLSDGDPKIYIPLDNVIKKLYPSAVHGLCSFHLVSQPLQRLRLQGRDKPQVKRVIETCVEVFVELYCRLSTRSHFF